MGLALAVVPFFIFAGRPVVQELNFKELVFQASHIVTAQYLKSKKIKLINGCEDEVHEIKIEKVHKALDQKIKNLEVIEVSINPMGLEDCHYRSKSTGKGVSFSAQRYNGGLELASIKTKQKYIYFLSKSRFSENPWSLVVNGAILSHSLEKKIQEM
ncbi:MAG: hypothetical protein ACK5V3_16600 [Bdellovibrionales bacterium]